MLKIEKSKLVEMLKYASLSLTEKSINPIARCVLFTGEDGVLTLRTTTPSFSETIVSSSGFEIKEPFTFMVDNFLLKILDSYPDGILQFNVKDNKIIVTSGKNKNSFALQDYTEYPDSIDVPKLNYTEITVFSPTDDKLWFCKTFKTLVVGLADNHPNKMLKGFNVNPHDNAIITADGDQIMRITDEKIGQFGNIACPRGDMIMPLVSLVSGLSKKDSLEVFFGTINCFKIKTENLTCETKIISIAGEYIENAKTFLNLLCNETKPKTVISVKKSHLKEIIDQAVQYYLVAYSKGDNEMTTMTVGDEVSVTMDIKDFSTMNRVVDCEIEGEPITINFMSKLLQEALGVMSEDVKICLYEDGLIDENVPTPFTVKDQNNENLDYLQVQMTAEE